MAAVGVGVAGDRLSVPRSPSITPSPSPVAPPPISLTLAQLDDFHNFSLDRTHTASDADAPEVQRDRCTTDSTVGNGADHRGFHGSVSSSSRESISDLGPLPVFSKSGAGASSDRLTHSEWNTLDVTHRVSVARLQSSPQNGPVPVDLAFRAHINTFFKKKLWNKVYTVFVVAVSCAGLQWEVVKRYTEFRQLHSQLESEDSIPKDVRKKIPKLPPRQLLGKEDDKFINNRMQQLDQYISALLAIPEFTASVPLLTFLGALQNKAEEEKEIPDVKAQLHIDAALQRMDSGDVILFRTAGIMPSMQRSVTSSYYDHVGVVCRLPPLSRQVAALHILEATSDGVKKYPLRSRLMAWDLSEAQVVWRQLSARRSEDFHTQLRDFVADMDGKQYGLNPINMIRRVSVQEKDSFFCSEIVAMALKRVGVLGDEKPSNSYLPVTFTTSGNIKLAGDASLGQEVLLQFHRPEVSKAQSTTDASASSS